MPARPAGVRLRAQRRGGAARPRRRHAVPRGDRPQPPRRVGSPARRTEAHGGASMSPPPATAASTRRHGARRAPAPRVPRRISGPTRAARPRAVAAGGAIALPRPVGTPPLGRRALRRAAALADHPLLERLLTGRAWIALLAGALIGIVFMQVSLLKLNAGIGRSVERAELIDRENADLRAAVSRLGSDDRLQAEAARLGLVAPPAGSVTFLGRDGKREGGDGPVALATGTATEAQPAGVGAGALTPATTGTIATAGASQGPAPAPPPTPPTAAPAPRAPPRPPPPPQPPAAPAPQPQQQAASQPAPTPAQPQQTQQQSTAPPAGGAGRSEEHSLNSSHTLLSYAV